jgi:hypothetical protein
MTDDPWDDSADQDIWEALSQDSDYVPIFKFKNEDAEIEGDITGAPELLPLTQYKSETPKLDSNGNPVMQVLVVLATDRREDADHDGRWRVYIDKPLMKAAVLRALKDANVRTLEPGGRLWLKRVSDRHVSSGGSAHDFIAKYTPPRGAGTPPGAGEIGETAAESDDAPPF